MLERHVPRAATEPAPSLQHDGQRRHAAEGHDGEQTRLRLHAHALAARTSPTERVRREQSGRKACGAARQAGAAALARRRAPAASLASYSAFLMCGRAAAVQGGGRRAETSRTYLYFLVALVLLELRVS